MKSYSFNDCYFSNLREIKAYIYGFAMPLRYSKFNDSRIYYLYCGVVVKSVKVIINPMNGYVTISRQPIY